MFIFFLVRPSSRSYYSVFNSDDHFHIILTIIPTYMVCSPRAPNIAYAQATSRDELTSSTTTLTVVDKRERKY